MTNTIVAVHGNGGGSTRFARLVDALDGSPWDVQAIDLPGFGGRPADPSLTSVADFADALAEMVPAGAVVLGHGIGGSIALDLAARRPETMAGLILHSPVGADLDTRWFPKLMSTPVVRETVRNLIASRPLRPIWRRLFFPNGADPIDLDVFFDGYRHCEVFGQMFEIIDADWFSSLPEVRGVPTMLLWGEHDRVLKAGHVDRFTALAPAATVRIEPGWDHFPMLEQPDGYARVIRELADALVAATR